MVCESIGGTVDLNSSHISTTMIDPAGILAPSCITVQLVFSADANQSEENIDLLVNQFAIHVRQMISNAYHESNISERIA